MRSYTSMENLSRTHQLWHTVTLSLHYRYTEATEPSRDCHENITHLVLLHVTLASSADNDTGRYRRVTAEIPDTVMRPERLAFVSIRMKYFTKCWNWNSNALFILGSIDLIFVTPTTAMNRAAALHVIGLSEASITRPVFPLQPFYGFIHLM